MTDLEAIEKRISRRAYTGPVPEREAWELSSLASKLAASEGMLIKLETDAAGLFGGMRKSYGMFKGVQSLLVLACREDDPDGREKAGWAGERLVLEATKLGLGTCWVGGTFDRSAAASSLEPGWKLALVVTIGPVADDPTGREKFIYRLAHRGSKTAEEMSTAQGEAPGWFAAGVEAAQRAPSAINKQPVHFLWRKGEAAATVGDDKGFQLVDLGIAKLHFEIGANTVLEKAGKEPGRFAYGSVGVFRVG